MHPIYKGRFVGRGPARDNLTYDRAAGLVLDSKGNAMGKSFGQRYTVHDGRVVDSSGAFLVGELERLDLTLNMPLAAYTWGRDIPLRDDVTIADDTSSFTNTTFGSAGGAGTGNGIGNGKAWAGKNTDQISGVGVDISKTPHPLRPWALEIKWSIFELESAARLGRPIDTQKYEGLQLKWNMDVDEQAYYGDLGTLDTGLINSASVTPQNLPNGAQGFPQWTTKDADEILADFNTALNVVWSASGWAVVPSRILLPTAQFGYIATQKVSQAGNMSILKYVLENNLLATSGRGKLEIEPVKWLNGAGVGGTIGNASTVNRMLVYTKDKKYARFPMTLLGRTPVQYDGLYHKTTYYGRLGVLEVPYSETVGYFDGL